MQVLLAYGLREPLQASLLAAAGSAAEGDGAGGQRALWQRVRALLHVRRPNPCSGAQGKTHALGPHILMARHVAIELSPMDVAVWRQVWHQGLDYCRTLHALLHSSDAHAFDRQVLGDTDLVQTLGQAIAGCSVGIRLYA